ncbi:MAG TPA: Ku protein [Trebonia sp.]|nr:Ku protein [Trebonia sp.]
MSNRDPLPSGPASSDVDPTFAPTATAPGRPSWSGLLQVGLLAVPVKAYPAVVSAPELPAHLLHAGCGQRLRDDKCCPRHGKLDAAAVVKGYEYAPGQFVVLDEAEMDQLRPARDRALALDSFLDLGQVDPLLYAGRSLYLTPAGVAARAAYAVLTQAMRSRRQAALARLVLSGRRRLALMRPAGALLLLHLLHYPAQVRSGAGLEAELRTQSVGVREARLAGELIDAYRRPPRWHDFVDDSAQALQALVQARLQGRAPSEPDLQPTPLPALLDALRQSVATLPAQTATNGVATTARSPSRRRSS